MKTTNENHWASQKEISQGYAHFKLMLFIVKHLPVLCMKLCAFPVSFFYFIFAKKARRESQRFLNKIKITLPLKKKLSSYKHFLSFSLSLVDKLVAWSSKIVISDLIFCGDDSASLIERLENNQGALVICSHLGNVEVLRARSSIGKTNVSHHFPVVSIVDFSVTENFNRLLKELNPSSMLHLINAYEINPGTITELEETLLQGGLVVIAGDRVSAETGTRTFEFPFLGQNAQWSEGPFYLASLLKVPVYFVFALRKKDISLHSKYTMHTHKSTIEFSGERRKRKEQVQELARSFVKILEYYTKEHPYQWYNFYDFWRE
ncbi:MAG: hypothetical protein LBV68_02440 [Spirochaetaceae bacterium]|jgi:predicted LPLAT superfamily acyltransferase|nr:hypothetical protein [Spirochaetaceae bacterium]